MCVVMAASESSARRAEEEETDSERSRRARVQDGQNRTRGRLDGHRYERMFPSVTADLQLPVRER